MWLGRFQLGQTVQVSLVCTDAAGTPLVPDAAPRLNVLDATGAEAFAVGLPVQDRFAVTGLFQYPLFLGAGFATGRYTGTLSYVSGSYVGLKAVEFDVIPGGHVDGHVLAMTFFRRPHGNFVVYQTESGKVAKGRNPYL